MEQRMKNHSVQKAKKFNEKTVVEMWRKLLNRVLEEKEVTFNLSDTNVNLSQVVHEYEVALFKLYQTKPETITVHDEYLPIYRRVLRYYRRYGAKKTAKATCIRVFRRFF